MNTWCDVSKSCLARLLGLALGMCLILAGCTSAPRAPRAFASPDEAVQAMISAARAQDVTQLLDILGEDGRDILTSGDPVADRQRRQTFIDYYDQKHRIAPDGSDRATLVVGNTDWPFPVPLVRDPEKGWFFDTAAGKEEILNRRIGQNELAAIQVCQAIGDAQREYALMASASGGMREYAQKFMSDPGKHNGLYWPTVGGEPPSPLGDLAAQAAAEGYTRRKQGPTPYHGYCYRILRAQGPNAPDGELDYLVKGRMVLGFAVVAYPADYGNSGIMTFIMGPDGVVYQKDLGKDTAKLATAMKAYDPAPGWTKAQ